MARCVSASLAQATLHGLPFLTQLVCLQHLAGWHTAWFLDILDCCWDSETDFRDQKPSTNITIQAVIHGAEATTLAVAAAMGVIATTGSMASPILMIRARMQQRRLHGAPGRFRWPWRWLSAHCSQMLRGSVRVTTCTIVSTVQ